MAYLDPYMGPVSSLASFSHIDPSLYVYSLYLSQVSASSGKNNLLTCFQEKKNQFI